MIIMVHRIVDGRNKGKLEHPLFGCYSWLWKKTTGWKKLSECLYTRRNSVAFTRRGKREWLGGRCSRSSRWSFSLSPRLDRINLYLKQTVEMRRPNTKAGHNGSISRLLQFSIIRYFYCYCRCMKRSPIAAPFLQHQHSIARPSRPIPQRGSHSGLM